MARDVEEIIAKYDDQIRLIKEKKREELKKLKKKADIAERKYAKELLKTVKKMRIPVTDDNIAALNEYILTNKERIVAYINQSQVHLKTKDNDTNSASNPAETVEMFSNHEDNDNLFG